MGIERLQMQEERISLLARERVARAQAEDAQRRLYDLFQQAPAIICVLRGPQHIYELANPLYLEIIGKREVLGKPIREALPELEDQGFFELLDRVYTSGESFTGNEVEVKLARQYSEELETLYLNFVYQPSRTGDGSIDGVLVYAVDVTELVKSRKVIKRSEERLTLAQRIGRIGSFEWDIQTSHIFWTPELEVLYGLPPGGFEGTYKNWAQHIHPDDLAQTQKSLYESTTKGATFNIEYRIIWPDKTIRWMLAKGDIIADSEGRPLRMVGVNIDITERKESEEQLQVLFQNVQELNANLETIVAQRTEDLRRTNTELQRSNQELQDFAYVASHDLQEPLRKIQAFGNLLEEEYRDTLADGNVYLDRMRSAARRMSVLIEDLLTFSRVTTKAQPLVPVDLNVIVQQIIEDLETRLQGTHGTIAVQPLPTINADPRQMYQMLQNLIANAVKFHRSDTPPIVKVSAEIQTVATTIEGVENEDVEDVQEQQCVLFVEDNGIGFDEKYLDRIFTVFQRLHGKSEYEGTGIGLAVVRKIVERHQGTVTAQSTPGQGTTFIVRLPVNQDEGSDQ
jgi:PAS domain S-box-containing protein